MTHDVGADGDGIEVVYYRDGRMELREVDTPNGWIHTTTPVELVQ